MAHAWPGNVRELENVIERALILSTGSTLRLEERLGTAARGTGQPSLERLDHVERAHIRHVLGDCDWKIDGKGHAAEKLGLHPNTLRSRMEKLGNLGAGASRVGAPGPRCRCVSKPTS